MAVSESDRAHFRRIGEQKAASHDVANAQHRALPLAERLRRSWQFCERFRDTVAPKPPRTTAPELYERAHRLGLYRP